MLTNIKILKKNSSEVTPSKNKNTLYASNIALHAFINAIEKVVHASFRIQHTLQIGRIINDSDFELRI